MKAMAEGDKEGLKGRLLKVLTVHVGRARRIGMGELYEEVFGERYNHRINDTRNLRELVDELQKEGVPVVSDSSQTGGYWLASTAGELDDYCGRLRTAALKKLKKEARLRKLTLPQLLGQIQLNLGLEKVEAAQ